MFRIEQLCPEDDSESQTANQEAAADAEQPAEASTKQLPETLKQIGELLKSLTDKNCKWRYSNKYPDTSVGEDGESSCCSAYLTSCCALQQPGPVHT